MTSSIAEQGAVADPTAVNRATHAAFVAAWARRDLDALMALVSDDVVYAASVGPEPGATFRGREAVRKGFEAMLAHDDALEVRGGRVTFVGDLGYAEWAYVVSAPNGGAQVVRGIDVLEFVDGRIVRKDAFRKTA
ncbi:MAG: nuclear transport factor 2 family protein [Vicinamibacterales bacterium]